METIYIFDAKTANVMSKHGWYVGRSIDITRYLASWKRDGYEVSAEAERFVKHLGGLSFKHAAYRAADQYDESVFDPLTAMNRLDSRWVKESYESLAKSSLCPIGSGYSQHMSYLISEHGEIYGGYDDYFCRIGRTVEEALYNIFFLREFEPVMER